MIHSNETREKLEEYQENRRKFLKWIVSVGAIAVSSSPLLAVLTQIWENADNKPLSEKAEQLKDSLKMIHSQNEYESKIKEISENIENIEERQVLLDLAMTWTFFGIIVPKFMSDELDKAIWISTPIILSWYLSSSETSKKDFREEMLSAWKAVWIMMVIITAAESICINFDNIIDKENERKFPDALKNLWDESKWIWEIYSHLNINIIDKKDSEHIRISNDWNSIDIPNNYLELLPLLKTWNIEEIREYISQKFLDKNKKEEAIDIMYINWLELKNVEISRLTKIRVNELTAKIIREEIITSLYFIFITQLITWVGQATMMKSRVYHCSEIVKNLAISNWISEFDANDIANKFIWLCASYYFNRLSSYSDLWPIMWAVKESWDYNKWGLNGILKFIDWMAPVAFMNIYPLINSVDNIIYSTGVDWSFIKDNSFINRPSSYQEFINKIFMIVSTWSKNFKFTDPSLVKNSKYRAIQKTTWNNKWNKGYIKLIEIFSNKENKESISENLLNLIDDIFYKKNDLWSIYGLDFMWVKCDCIDLILYLKFVKESSELSELHSKLDYVLEKHSEKIKLFSKKLHHYKWNEIINEVQTFINENLNINSCEWYKEEIYNLILSKIANWKKNTENTELIDAVCQNSEYDIDFCLFEWIAKSGSIKWVWELLRNNLKFLSYVKFKSDNWKIDSNIYENIKNTLSINLLNIDNKEFELYKNYIWSNFNQNEINILNILLEEDNKVEKISENTLFINAEEKFNKNKKYFQEIFGDLWDKNDKYYFGSIKTFIHFWEEYLWMNNYEVLQMILLIQAPYVISVKNTIIKWLDFINWWAYEETQKMMVWGATFFISMFADNYVWLVVWIKILREKFWIDTLDAIQYIWKFSVVWGSKVITWNAPNAILKRKGVPTYYHESELRPEIENEKNKSLFKSLVRFFMENSYFNIRKWSWFVFSDWNFIEDFMIDVLSLHYTPNLSDLAKWNISMINIVWTSWQVFRKKILENL